MGAIKNKKSGLKSPERLYNRYSGVPVVYVESDEDQYVFGECWFKEQSSRLEFNPVAARQGNAGEATSGCNAVIDAVRAERIAGNPAWGIVDRDAVFSHRRWDLVHETDDRTFDEAKPFGRHVKVLRRWEMESYLIDVPCVEKCRAEYKMGGMRPEREVWAELLTDCQALVPHAALNAVHHEFCEEGVGDGRTNRMVNRSDVENRLIQPALTALAARHSTCSERYAQYLSGAEAFDEAGQEDPVRVASLLRRVHGKAVLSRFESRHGLQSLKGPLAARIKEAGRVPDELKEFVSHAVTED